VSGREQTVRLLLGFADHPQVFFDGAVVIATASRGCASRVLVEPIDSVATAMGPAMVTCLAIPAVWEAGLCLAG
jgi:hypothetical protein